MNFESQVIDAIIPKGFRIYLDFASPGNVWVSIVTEVDQSHSIMIKIEDLKKALEKIAI